MSLYESTGILAYDEHKLIVRVDQDLADYYRRLIPPYKNVRRQRYPAHISVVRNEVPPHQALWGKYEGQPITFWYDTRIRWGQVYWWLECYCRRLEEIRLELGLPVHSEYTRPPGRFRQCFHCTLGNCK